MPEIPFHVTGLKAAEVLASRKAHGENVLSFRKENRFLRFARSLLTDPMILLLFLATSIYFMLGEYGDGIFLMAAIILVWTISFYQDRRSQMALDRLTLFSKPMCRVIREGEVKEIPGEEVVLGDLLMVEQGSSVTADGRILHANDFSVNESLISGESLPVFKKAGTTNNNIYRGTIVTSGLAIAKVTAIGNETRLGRIGKDMEQILRTPTPLELQIRNFVKKMTLVGSLIFLLVWGINFFRSYDLADSLLKGLTLAMSVIPEEIPIAFTTFMALGAWKLMKLGVVVKDMKTVEALGNATVICSDKTGTITRNEMALACLFSLDSGRIWQRGEAWEEDDKELIRLAMWASEPIPFDPMEIALHEAYDKCCGQQDERPDYRMVHEYPLAGEPPLMTHIFQNQKEKRIIAAKGAPEAFLNMQSLDARQRQALMHALNFMANQGFRVLGVAEAGFEGDEFPPNQQQLPFRFRGLVAFYDPPKEGIGRVFRAFQDAGIRVKIITGDNRMTTYSIARQIGFPIDENVMEGETVMALNREKLIEKVRQASIFTRMYPEAKLKVIEAFKANGEIVAMTGDGVNDGPALRAAHIGIAMGKKGTAIARDAAALILLDDDLSRMVDAVAMGRRIYANLKKAIQYIISIHIPIILMVFLPLALGWQYPNIFSPVHIIILELIMGPTCSIVYENEPMEPGTMKRGPRRFTHSIFNGKELITSLLQGLGITLGAILSYQLVVRTGGSESLTRTAVFTTIIAANMMLTLVNRSFLHSLVSCLRYRNKLLPLILTGTLFLLLMMLFVPPMTVFFEFEQPDAKVLVLSLVIGLISAAWYEAVKWFRRIHFSASDQ